MTNCNFPICAGSHIGACLGCTSVPRYHAPTCAHTDKACTEGCSSETACGAPSKKTRNPKDIAATAKVPMSVLPPIPLVHTAQVMRSGTIKYGPANWRDEPIKETVYADALWRHFLRYLAGEDIDRDSGAPHLAHIAANCFILMDAIANGVLTRDRIYANDLGPDAINALLSNYEEANRND